ncbi:rhodanese-like domain-containing protein [Candidatus Synchoanobacter obligatus]|uniref:Rhodanese-like domain-containing protein n=1 Tax=Candidatus Synchoanobacter obligatus TaxID=2919597 RepID=A0ABT1L497_9GAMM|nr:rhodanese-like domain-containing protein [Candidatus Synchoanobacter obligatus]MCP8351693.1 rhodanese-like domain-containing protein [Candidatus Synchoanobacter obligatus]
MWVNVIDYWALWLPLLVVVSLHLLEFSKSQTGALSPKDVPAVMRKRLQIYSFQSEEEYLDCHIKGAKRIDITDIDTDAFLMEIEKKYPVFCYCNDGKQSYRYFQRVQGTQKAYWLAGGLVENASKIAKYCVWRVFDD